MSVDDLYQKACDAVERANYDYAVELFREVLRQEPEYKDARLALRGTERRRAEEKGRSLVGMLAWPVRRLVTTLKTALAKPPKKIEAYEDFLQSYPSSFWALMRLAAAARRAGYEGEAVNAYKDALRFKPSNKKALRALSEMLGDSGQHQEALKYLTRLAALQPGNRDLQKELRDLTAAQHMTSHDMESAESFHELVRDRAEAERLEAAGRLDVTMDDLRHRVTQAEQELAEHPDSVNRILRLARLYEDLGELPKAVKLLREKHQAMPKNYELRERLGDLQTVAYDRAIESARERLEADPDDAAVAARLKELQQRKQQFAVKEYQWRLAQHPGDRALHLRLGRAYYETEDYNAAIAAFQNASQDPRYEMETSKWLGLCFMAKGQHDLALERFEAALQGHPGMDEEGKELRYCQAQAYEGMGRPDEALKLYKRIYSQDINFKDVAAKVDALSA
jgi:tetratricopeptide (TPR) repeat protein